MKLTKQTLKRIIKEELDEAITQADPSLSIDQADPNDGLFRIMDQVVDRALDYLGVNKGDENYQEAEDDLMVLSNEVVTARLQDIDGMAGELVEKFLMKK